MADIAMMRRCLAHAKAILKCCPYDVRILGVSHYLLGLDLEPFPGSFCIMMQLRTFPTWWIPAPETSLVLSHDPRAELQLLARVFEVPMPDTTRALQPEEVEIFLALLDLIADEREAFLKQLAEPHRVQRVSRPFLATLREKLSNVALH